jgi:hypothetical protein
VLDLADEEPMSVDTTPPLVSTATLMAHSPSTWPDKLHFLDVGDGEP